MSTRLDSHIPERALLVMAHPDDLEYTCAGTIAKWCAAGSTVHLLVLTQGQGGTGRGGESGEALARVRVSETETAARILGLSGVAFADAVDGHIHAHDHELRERIGEAIEAVRPETLITWSPRYNLDALQLSHPDHLACGQNTLEAVYPGRHLPQKLWLIGDSEASIGVDVSEHWPVARQALLAHASQADEQDAVRRESQLAANGRAMYGSSRALVEHFRDVRIGL